MNFNREDRYFVFKRSDLLPHQAKGLDGLRATANELRGIRGKPPLECAVVESDWPEYETVWDMIQGRVEGEQAERIHRDMVLENNRIAEQSDQAVRAIRSNPALAAPYGEDDGIMQFDDPYQAMAFLLWKDVD